MRTGRSLTVCCSLLPGGGVPPWQGGVSAWSGGVLLGRGGSPWSGGVLLGPGGFSLVPGGCLPGPGGVSAWSRGGFSLVQGGFSLLGGCLPGPGGVISPWSWGVSAWSRGGSPETPPPVYRITDTCKKHNLGHNFVAAGKICSTDVQKKQNQKIVTPLFSKGFIRVMVHKSWIQAFSSNWIPSLLKQSHMRNYGARNPSVYFAYFSDSQQCQNITYCTHTD